MSLNETVTMVTKGSECDVGIHKPKPWAIAMWKLFKKKTKKYIWAFAFAFAFDEINELRQGSWNLPDVLIKKKKNEKDFSYSPK